MPLVNATTSRLVQNAINMNHPAHVAAFAIIVVTNRKTNTEAHRASVQRLDQHPTQAPWYEQLGFPAQWGGMLDGVAYSWCGAYVAKVVN